MATLNVDDGRDSVDAAASTVANLAAGAGRRTRADAGHHDVMARGSAMECAAHLDVMTAMASSTRSGIGGGSVLEPRGVAMLTQMCDL